MDYYLLYLKAYLHFKSGNSDLKFAHDDKDKKAYYVVCFASHSATANVAPMEETEFLEKLK